MAPHIALTLGDPAGIGPEIVLKFLAKALLSGFAAKITVVGDYCQVATAYETLRPICPDPLAHPDHIPILDLDTHFPITLGQGDAHSGAASFAYLAAAIAGVQAGVFDALVTAPIAKSAWQLAGHTYAGQTELLAQRSGVEDFGMLFVARSPHTGWILRTLLTTVHIPLGSVCQHLSSDLVRQKLHLLARSLQQDFGLPQAKVAVAGINPHSGENGQLGTEEQAWLQPLIDRWQHPYLTLSGPIPPDTFWLKPAQAWWHQDKTSLGQDAYVAMYHDQGLIAIKLLAFTEAVNCTIGLPFVRTSPDHGTAFDIAGKGIANYQSLEAAVHWAIEMCNYRSQFAILQNTTDR